MLDVFTGGVERVAESYEKLIAELKDRAWQEGYLWSYSAAQPPLHPMAPARARR